MREHIENICTRTGFGTDATVAFSDAYDCICKTEAAKALFFGAVYDYEQAGKVDFGRFKTESDSISSLTGVHRYTVNMLMLLAFTKTLRTLFDKAGYSETMFWDVLADLRCKNNECMTVQGVFGSFVSEWQLHIFNLELVAFGRLEYGPKRKEKDFTLNGEVLPTLTDVISAHIPSNGRLDIAQCRDSLRRAHSFFKARTGHFLLPFLAALSR